jgi:transposase
MSKDVPPPAGQSPRQLSVSVEPAPGIDVVPSDDANAATVKVPVVRIPVDQLSATPQPAPAAVSVSDAAEAGPPMPAVSGIDGLPDDPRVLKQMIAELLRALRQSRRHEQEVRQRLDALLKRLYGPRPDPIHPDQGLLSFGDDAPMSHVPLPPPPPAEEEPSRRGKSRPHGRRQPARELRREQRRYELTAAERLCPECHQQRQEIGVDATPQYDYKPAEVFVVEHQRVKYACKHCQGHVTIAPKPPQPIDRGLPGPGLLAQIIMDKHQDHIPLHRSEQRYLRLGVHLPRSTMCDWMASAAKLLTPLCQELKDWILQSKVLHTDDTTVPVRDETRSSHRYGRLWPYIGDAAHPGIVFDYTTTHARDGPAAFLKNFRGYLQADAYGAYDGIYTGSGGAIIEVGCWAHARNKAAEAETSDPERVLAIKAWVRKLYDVEDEAAPMTATERLRLRQEKSVPLLTCLRQWLIAQRPQVLPKSPIAAAMNYMLNQWQALNRYTTDGDLHIDNNLAERTLKLIGTGRDNWLFLGSDQGGQTAAVLYSFTATCKHLGIDTFTYLRDVFTRLPSQPAERLEELLPHRWQAARQAATSFPTNTPSS